MRCTYRQLDHTGDVGIEAEAGDENSLYSCCARALFDIIAGPECCEPATERQIVVEAPDREILLVRWLRELLYLHDAERWLFSRFDVLTGESPDGGRCLRGLAWGERFDPARHRLRTELKAVTYHQIAVRRDPGGIWRARVIFDI